MSTTTSILDTIPCRVRRGLLRHLGIIDAFNIAVQGARGLEAMLGQPGRYEHDVRLAQQAQADESLAWLAEFASRSAALGICAAAVYAALGTAPALLPWSQAALAWRRDV